MSLQLRTKLFFQSNHPQIVRFHFKSFECQFPFSSFDAGFHWLNHGDFQSFGHDKWCEFHERFALSSSQEDALFGWLIHYQQAQMLQATLGKKEEIVQAFLSLRWAFQSLKEFTRVLYQGYPIVYLLRELQNGFVSFRSFSCCITVKQEIGILLFARSSFSLLLFDHKSF